MNGDYPDRLLTGSTGPRASPTSRPSRTSQTHHGRSATEALPLPAEAADRAMLGFSSADLREQAEAIGNGIPFVLRATVT